jgi:SagB-type dehydrogenase family enzyme
MNTLIQRQCFALTFFLAAFATPGVPGTGLSMAQSSDPIALPEPAESGERSLEQVLQQRRSEREYKDDALELTLVGQLLWAAQGITHGFGMRTAPSAGALYPLELYVVAGNVNGLAPGLYHYHPRGHKLTAVRQGDMRSALSRAALGQSWVKEAAAVVVFTAQYERTTVKYGQRGVRYVHIEVGHAAQNLFLQAMALDLGTVVVGAFEDEAVADVLQLPEEFKPLLLMPVGEK